jgi:hypothetical protein
VGISRVTGIVLIGLLLGVVLLPSAEAHRSGCHRWHSCPSDTGSYVCGDIGYCSMCPDNKYCLAGKPRLDSHSDDRGSIPTQPRAEWPNGREQK